jgi:hypothetical protein
MFASRGYPSTYLPRDPAGRHRIVTAAGRHATGYPECAGGINAPASNPMSADEKPITKKWRATLPAISRLPN